jgi:RNA polymerase sigma-70 factor (ECF subfamily)
MASVVTRAGPLEVSDDARIAQRVREVVGEHYDFVWRSLRRLGVPEATADDAAQQVFCVFARRCDAVPLEKEKTFLFGVVIRVAQNVRRARARRPEVHDDDAIASHRSDAPDPEQAIDDRRARELLDTILTELPMDLRTVFVLYELEELTMAEIATMLDLPNGTVASRLRRARETFEMLAESAAKGRERSSR